MKKSQHTPHDADSRAVETIVEDLAQQDVLPADVESSIAPDIDTLVDQESQSGRWDEPVGEFGHRANRTPLEDETKASELLVSKGLREAEEDLRDIEEEEDIEEEQEDT